MATVRGAVRIEIPVFGGGSASFRSADYWAKRLVQGARIRSIELYEMKGRSMWKTEIENEESNDVKG